MRVLAFIGVIVVANILTLGGIALIVLTAPHAVEGLIWLPLVSLAVLVFAPITAGAFVAYWDPRASPQAWTFFRRWFIGIVAVHAVGVVAISVFTALAGASLWLPFGDAVAAAALTFVALRIGTALRQREEARQPARMPWTPITRQEIVRRIAIVAMTFVVLALVGGIGISVLLPAVTGSHRLDGRGLLLAGQLAFMGAAIACIAATIGLQRRIRGQVTRDAGLLRRVGKVVLRGKPVPLEPDEETVAARYAVIVSTTLPFTFAYIVLLYVGLGLQQVGQLMSSTLSLLSTVMLVVLAVVLIAFAPIYVIRIRRVRAYARTHAGRLLDPGSEAPGS